MFNIDKKYITIGIKEQIGIDIQLFMWNEIEKRINLKKELDYLQVFNISIIDKETVLAAAEEMQIDGIMSFACDPGVVTAAYVAEKMNLPFQCSYESASILQDKGLFRQFLTDHKFNCPVK